MKQTGFIRKIDSMGRVVIPKDLRKELNIRDDDNLILSYDNNCISINKYQFNDKLNRINNIIDCTKDILQLKIKIVSYEKIIKEEDNKIPYFIKSAIMERKEYYSSSIETINIDNNLIEGYFGIIPLIYDSNIIGVMFLQKEDIVNDQDKIYIRIIQRFVENIDYL